MRGVDAAVEDKALISRGPAMGREVGASELPRGVTALQCRGVREGLGPLRMPLYLDDLRISMGAWRPPDEKDDLLSIVGQTLGKCPANQAGSAAQQ
jgi:hypothetical protein